ncbi:SDR family NAD(P)-dependent oxidoreductase [Bosea sp. F3-2]|nr:SDR family NAD(P)-dependent oxidoreductase [Bosea sp. F3-2]
MAKGQTVVITGATGGLGQCAAIDLARHGARLVLTARDKQRAEITVNLIKAETPGAEVDVVFGDFSDLASVAEIGRQIIQRHGNIDVLINNAGLHAFSPRFSRDGHAEMVTVNYLAPWLLTHILRGTLMRSGSSRIVTVGSDASRRGGTFDPLAVLVDCSAFSARGSSALYGRTKTMAILFSMELARQLTVTHIAANALCPGFNVTGLGRELSFAAPLEQLLKWLNIGDPRRGATLIVELAINPAFKDVSGGYFMGRRVRQVIPPSPGDDLEVARALWIATEKELSARGYI